MPLALPAPEPPDVAPLPVPADVPPPDAIRALASMYDAPEPADVDDAPALPAEAGCTQPVQQSTVAVDQIDVCAERVQIANAMQDSKRRIPHFGYIEEVDVSEVEALRVSLNDRYGDSRPRLTLLPFIVRAMVHAVAQHRSLNAHYDAAGLAKLFRELNDAVG